MIKANNYAIKYCTDPNYALKNYIIRQKMRNKIFLLNNGKLGIGGGVSQAAIKSSTGQSFKHDPQAIISKPEEPPSSEDQIIVLSCIIL